MGKISGKLRATLSLRKLAPKSRRCCLFLVKVRSSWHLLFVRRRAIYFLHVACLAIILIGVPAATSVRFGSLRIGSRPATESAILAALAAVVLLDGLGRFVLAANAKEKTLWRNWGFCAAGLLVFHWALFEGFFHFDWLREMLWRARAFFLIF